MTQLITVPPDPRCDECGNSVEQEQIERSARANNGIPLGPWLCKSCEGKNAVEFQHNITVHQHNMMLQNNSFDTLCNEVDPKLAEAIHRAGLS